MYVDNEQRYRYAVEHTLNHEFSDNRKLLKNVFYDISHSPADLKLHVRIRVDGWGIEQQFGYDFYDKADFKEVCVELTDMAKQIYAYVLLIAEDGEETVQVWEY